jgi:hypothetical protein
VLISFTVRAALATLLLCSPLQAQAYEIAGVGLHSCGSWTAARSRSAAGLEVQWVLGYLSGVAYALQTDRVDPLGGIDDEAIFAWIDNYCRAKPLSPTWTWRLVRLFSSTHVRRIRRRHSEHNRSSILLGAVPHVAFLCASMPASSNRLRVGEPERIR